MSVKGWLNFYLSEIGDCIRGVSYIPSDLKLFPDQETISLLRSNNIRDGNINFIDLQYVKKNAVKEQQILRANDIAICMSNGNRFLVGKTGQFQQESIQQVYTVGAFCAIFRSNNKFNRQFVRYLFNSATYQKQLDEILAGSAINNLKNSDIENIKVICPNDYLEQEKIAGVLSTIDRAIAQTEAIIAKQQRIKTGLMQDLLTKGIDENGNIRSEATHEFKDSRLGRIPVEWNVQCLEDLLDNIYQGWSPDCESDSASEDEWGVLKTTAVTWDGYNSQENKKLPNNLKPRPSLEVKEGDVLITRAGPNSRVGVISYVYETLKKKIISDKIYNLKFKENLEPRFFVYSLSGFASQQYLSALKTGMAESQTNISQEIVKKMLTVIPSIEEQIAISDLLDKSLQGFKEYLITKNKLDKLKTGLMQDLLTGEVRVTNLLNQKAASN